MAVKFIKQAEDVQVLDASDLTLEERKEFDYLDWEALEQGRGSASFVRYEGTTYPLNDFSADWGITRGTGLPEEFTGWDGYLSDSFFSGVVIRYHGNDEELVNLATFITGD